MGLGFDGAGVVELRDVVVSRGVRLEEDILMRFFGLVSEEERKGVVS